MEEPNNDYLQFEWGTKRGLGGAKKDAQFYGSFTFDQEYYTLYDCVYLCKEGETTPYIGKIVKIWEHSDGKKKVKILWFFHPSEIFNHLGDSKPLEKELFLASGEGVGLANINPLEAIAGKCSVICTSKDERNPQPSKDALEKADYIFYRAFDVGTLAVSDKLPDKIASIDVKFLLNRENQVEHAFPISKANGSDIKEKAEAGPAINALSKYEALKLDENEAKGTALELDENKAKVTDPVVSVSSKGKVVEKKTENEAKPLLDGSSDPKSKIKSSQNVGEANNSLAHLVDKKVTSLKNKAQSDIGDNNPSKKMRTTRDDLKTDDLQKNKHATGANNAVVKPVEDDFIKSSQNVGDANNSLAHLVDKVTSVEKKAQSDIGDNNPSKKMRLTRDDLKTDNLQKNKHATGTNNAVVKPVEDDFAKSLTQNKESFEKMNLSEKKVKSSNMTIPKVLPSDPVKGNTKLELQTMEVTQRPDVDRSKWFKGIPWADKMQKAHEQGTLMLLQNLDRSLSSSAIEDIIYHAFKQSCSAKVIPFMPPYHNPHYGQAYVIFKTPDAAAEAIQRINKGCLMLPNGSPLIASKGMLPLPTKANTFPGHLSFNNLRKMQREDSRKAVSTSHCSQPNTIEYEMAMEWILGQEKAAYRFNRLHKMHHDDVMKVKKNVKTNK